MKLKRKTEKPVGNKPFQIVISFKWQLLMLNEVYVPSISSQWLQILIMILFLSELKVINDTIPSKY